MKRSSVLFTELDRRLSLSNNNQNKRKYKEENKKCRKNRQREKQRDFDTVNNKTVLRFCSFKKKFRARKNTRMRDGEVLGRGYPGLPEYLPYQTVPHSSSD